MDRSYLPIYEQMPAFENLHLGITTRVMAKQVRRMSLEMAQKTTAPGSRRSSLTEGDRIPSKFLTGAAIPNSVIKADISAAETSSNDEEGLQRERDEYVAKLLKRLQPKEKLHDSIYDESVDRNALAKIKQELQRRSLDLPSKSSSVANEHVTFSTIDNAMEKIAVDPWQEIKEKRRISRRTSILAPLGGERRSTYESIRKAIQNSKLIQQLIDADNLGEQKMKKQMQSGKSLVYPEYSFAKAPAAPAIPEETTPKSEDLFQKPSVEKRHSTRRISFKKKHSHKSSIDKSFHGSGSKSALRYSDEFKSDRKSFNLLGSKTGSRHSVEYKNEKAKISPSILKSEELQAQTSFTINHKK